MNFAWITAGVFAIGAGAFVGWALWDRRRERARLREMRAKQDGGPR